MSIPKLFRLSISEFAELCHSNRKTLIYYDSIGLLKPFGRTEQGYRYYSSTQSTQFQLIQLLQSAHYSLDEIKQVLSKPYLYEDMSFLAEKYNNLLEERKKLDDRLAQFSTLIEITKDKKEHFYCEPTLIYRDTPEYFFATTFPTSLPEHEDTFYAYLQKHTSQLMKRTDVSHFPLCMLIDVNYFPDETQIFSGFCHRYTNEATDFDKEHTYILPAGYYITCNCCGNLDIISNTLLSMYEFALQNHYTITGSFLSTANIFNFSINSNEDNKTQDCRILLPVSIKNS